ncbi:integrating conjugative element protein [Pseudoalteromonas distincta]|uniref:integrating conjugative element protein n=1 Tax=Pseudoalteromonas distincta TaxID=77608 RepID=UPI001193AFAD|nr:integrating conjugative element protein [Pseudoalteromonas elyakovii]TVU70415.1 integrating conjugative element protein [Pseudoalteromonas elyakovii]
MKKTIVFTALLLAFTSNNTLGAEKKLDPRLVFEIGGKAKIKQRRNRLIPVGAGVRWETPMCGNFDMSLSVSNVLNGVSGQLEKLADDLLASVTGAISNWPMMEIARADPQLYEFIQQGKVEASEIFNGSVASCEEMTDKIISEGYGTAGSVGSWVDMSGFEDWGNTDSDNDDVVQKDDDIKENKGDSGVTWIDGRKAGGKDQDPIETVADTVKAGTNLLSNRNVRSNSNFPDSEGVNSPWFAKYWSDPEDAAKWVISIVGETTLRTCLECERLNTTPGKGVYSILEEKQNQLELRLIALLDAPIVSYDAEILEAVSAPGYAISQQVMEALKSESIYQTSLVERLAEEVAIVDTVERLIAARRILLTGKKEANIAQNPDAVLIIDNRITELGQEMELLRQDAELRATTKQSVAVTLIERKMQRDNQRFSNPSTDTTDAIRNISGRSR